jgi:assimilatory nitrate reductase catalytic subunit
MAWLPDGEALSARTQLKHLMAAFPFTSCVPFSNNTPLADRSRERTGVLFRAAGYEAPSASVLAQIEAALCLSGTDALRYADPKKGQHRTARLVRLGEQVELTGFVLAGDTSAEAWIKTLLLEELPAQAYGRQLLLPGAKAPMAVQSRGKPICTCFNVTDAAIADQLALIHEEAGGAADLMRDDQRLMALQGALKCGTNCGSCVPELKRLVRSAKPAPALVHN